MKYENGCFPMVAWEKVKPDYSHIKDPWVKSVFEMIDRADFEVDKALAQTEYLKDFC